MLKAKKNKFVEKLFAVYNKNLLKRRFHSFNVEGLGFLANLNKTLPLIIYVNHSSWWDGLLVFHILQNFNFVSFVMMEEKHLLKYSFFRRLGAFSVDRDNPRDAIKSIEYISEILNNNNACVLVIFPQGKLAHNDKRPFYFYNGISRIVEKIKNCQLASLSIRIEHLKEFKPQIFVKIEEPEKIEVNSMFMSKLFTKHLSDKMTFCLDHLKNDIVNNQTQKYQDILK
jgi:chlorobactene lauroyltransferase